MGRRSTWLTLLALAGVLGPCLFTMLVVVQATMQPDYHHVEMPISALAAWPAGWIQNLNFYAFGASMIAFAAGFHLGLRPTRHRVVGPAILAVGGLGGMLAGWFPMARAPDGAIVEPIGHVVSAFMTFLGTGIGFVVVSRRMRGDPRWAGMASVTRAVGVGMLVMFLAMAAVAAQEGAPLHRWFGLLQRVILVLWFPWQIALGVRLLRVARPTSEPLAGRSEQERALPRTDQHS